MNAVLLAAGVGRRLGAKSRGLPKCLIQCGGQSLLARHLTALEKEGIQTLHIITGYGADAVEAAVQQCRTSLRVQTIYNPCFRRGSLVSLWCARHIRSAGDSPTLLMDADVLYDPRILQPLLAPQTDNCLLMDRDFPADEEPVQVCIDQGRIVEFRKNPPPEIHAEIRGESVGFFRLSPDGFRALVEGAGQQLRLGREDAEYEEVLRELILDPSCTFHFSYADITGLPWTEIDFPEDLQRAEKDVLERILPSER